MVGGLRRGLRARGHRGPQAHRGRPGPALPPLREGGAEADGDEGDLRGAGHPDRGDHDQAAVRLVGVQDQGQAPLHRLQDALRNPEIQGKSLIIV